MPDARNVRDFDRWRILLGASAGVGELWQMSDGRVAYFDQPAAGSSGERKEFTTEGVCTITKTNGVKLLRGGRLYWDHSANSATYKPANDRDCYIGTLAEDAESGDQTCECNINAHQENIIDFQREEFATVYVGTRVLGGFNMEVRGGAREFTISATNEAQKIDMLSDFAFAKTANAIIEGIAKVVSDGAGTVVDASLGIANATHASDADAITEHLLVHLDANNTNINLQSKDGTTTVAATDTTLDYTEGTAFEFWIDMRDPADVQVYINGALVLGSTVFNVDAGTGPFKLLLHLEKSISTDTYVLMVNRFVARLMEQ